MSYSGHEYWRTLEMKNCFLTGSVIISDSTRRKIKKYKSDWRLCPETVLSAQLQHAMYKKQDFQTLKIQKKKYFIFLFLHSARQCIDIPWKKELKSINLCLELTHSPHWIYPVIPNKKNIKSMTFCDSKFFCIFCIHMSGKSKSVWKKRIFQVFSFVMQKQYCPNWYTAK